MISKKGIPELMSPCAPVKRPSECQRRMGKGLLMLDVSPSGPRGPSYSTLLIC